MATAATVMDPCGEARGEMRWLTGSRKEVAVCSGRLIRGVRRRRSTTAGVGEELDPEAVVASGSIPRAERK